MTYIDVWLEESNKEHPFKEAEISVTATPNNIVFYKDIKGKEKYTAGSPIKYQELVKERGYLKEYSKNKSDKGIKSKKIRLYLSATSGQDKPVKVNFNVQLKGNLNDKSIRINEEKTSNSTPNLKTEDLDGFLNSATKAEASRLIDTETKGALSKQLVALSKAAVHKNGHNSSGIFYTNIIDERMKDALKMIYEYEDGTPVLYLSDGGEYTRVKQTHLPGSKKQIQTYTRERDGAWDEHWIKMEQTAEKQTVYSKRDPESNNWHHWKTIDQQEDAPVYKVFKANVNLNAYFTLVEKGLRNMTKTKPEAITTLHPLIKSSIKSRIDALQTMKYIPDSKFTNRAPGLHAEVFAVNDVLTRYFKHSTDDSLLNKITEVTYKLTGRKGKGTIEFPACMNCNAILSPHVRIPTGANND